MTNPIQRMLLPIDFSEGSHEALKFGAAYAHAIGASLHVLHVIDVPYFAYADFHSTLVSGGTLEAESLAQARRMLRDELKHLPSVWAKNVELVVRSGSSAREIKAEAEKEECDLILLATHGRTGLRRFLIGSVAEAIVRTAPCPVMTGRFADGARVPGAEGPARICVATDLSELSLGGLAYATRLAQCHDPVGELDLVYVLEDISRLPAVGWDEFPDLTPELFYARGEERAVDELRDCVRKHVPRDLPCNVHVLRGDPASRLLEFAESHSTDLLVTTTHGRTGISHAVIGSVAERVVRTAPCPVLTVKSGMLPD